MGLTQLAEKCQVCPFVSKCDHKRMEALAYFSEPAMPTITTEAVGNEPIVISNSDRISVEDAVKVFNDFARQAYLHKMGL